MDVNEAVGQDATEKNILLPKSDLIFKLLFGDERNSDILMDFLKSVLRLPADEYASVEIVDPHLQREGKDDKLCILDVKLKTKSGKVIDIEAQVAQMPQMRERVIYYLAKMVTEQLGSGDDYYNVKQAISIVVTDFEIVPDSADYHHRFTMNDGENRVEFSDLMEIHTLELRKLPTETDGTPLYDWVRFIGAEGVDEMQAVAEMNPIVGEALARVKVLSADERTRLLYEERQKAWRDNATRMRGAREEGKAEGKAEGEYSNAIATARRALEMNMPIDGIMTLTRLTRAEIEGLKD